MEDKLFWKASKVLDCRYIVSSKTAARRVVDEPENKGSGQNKTQVFVRDGCGVIRKDMEIRVPQRDSGHDQGKDEKSVEPMPGAYRERVVTGIIPHFDRNVPSLIAS